jgi:hypothetical protein
VQIQDQGGKPIQEVTVTLTSDEVTELLVGTSQIDDGSRDHAFLRDHDGTVLAVYRDDTTAGPLKTGTDWWVGPILLLAALLLIVGAFTIARGVVGLLF